MTNDPPATEPARARRALLAVALAAFALWAWIAVPLLLGQRTFFLRDVFSVHLPLKAYGAAELRLGRIPAFDDRWALGAPFRGNPQALAFYPDNLAYLVLPFWSAFNLHFVLHWLLAALTMRALARALGLTAAGQMAAALSYAGGGVVLSALSFYNLLTVLAWWPAVMAGTVRGDRRGIAAAGLCCGLAMLGGEPITLAIACVPLAWAAREAHGARRGAALTCAALGLGLLVALPQIVATARILGFTFRLAHGIEAAQAAAFALHPARLLELLVPLPWGWPARAGAEGWWAARVVPRPPFFFSLYVGAVGFGLLLAGARNRRGWAALAAGGVFLAWLGGAAGPTLSALSGGLFRYPEKFLVVFALAAPLLIGYGLERVAGASRTKLWWIAAASCAVLAAGIGVARLGLPAAPGAANVLQVQSARWALYLFAAAMLFGCAAFAVGRQSAVALVALQLCGLVQLWPLLPRVETAPLDQPPAWLSRVGTEAALHSPTWAHPRWVDYTAGPRTLPELAAVLDPAPNVLRGLSYPLAPDFEGLGTPYYTLLQRNLAGLGWHARARWMQIAGVDYAVLYGDPADPDLELLDSDRHEGYEARLYRVRDPAPLAFWPRTVASASNPVEALGMVPGRPALERAIAAEALTQDPAGIVTVERAAPDRIELRVRGGGGLAVVRRAYHPLWRATVDGQPAAVESADLVLTGIPVPAGEHRVVLAASGGPEALAGLAACIAALALLWVRFRA